MLKSKILNFEIKKGTYYHPYAKNPRFYKHVKIYHLIPFTYYHHEDIYRPLFKNDLYVCLNLNYATLKINSSYPTTYPSITLVRNIPFAIVFSNII